MRFLAIILSMFLVLGCASTGSKFKLREHKELQLKNGLKVFLIEDKSLPYFSVTALIRSGSSTDPKNKQGLTSLVSDLLNKGSEKRTALEIADSIAAKGSKISITTEQDFVSISGTSLSFYKEEFLTDFSEILLQPAFKNAEIMRAKKQVLSQIKQTVDNPSQLASVAFEDLLYGEHPYGKRVIGNKKDMASIKRKDVIKHYFRYYRPNNTTLAVVGNFDPKKIKGDLEKHFGQWQKRNIIVQTFPGVPQIKGRQIELISKPGLEQSQIRIGHLGIKRKNDDYLTLKVANLILGGAYFSHLNKEIRVKRGLTYGASSYFIPRLDNGPFLISTFSRHEKVGETVQTAFSVIEQFKKNGVTDDEVKEAKGYLKGAITQIIATPEDLARNLIVLDMYGVPESYLSRYIQNVDAISTSDVNKVIKKYFDPENMNVVIFGSKTKTYKQVKNLGDVKIRSYKSFL